MEHPIERVYSSVPPRLGPPAEPTPQPVPPPLPRARAGGVSHRGPLAGGPYGGAPTSSVRPSRPTPAPMRPPSAYLAFGAWAMSVLAIGFFAAAQPPAHLGFFDLFGGAVRTHWDATDLRIALVFAVAACFLAVSGLTIDALSRARWNGPALAALGLAGAVALACLYLS
ncbi:MAG: hypothetical protein AB7S26_23600 [Sandaracinaceae bacterium]